MQDSDRRADPLAGHTQAGPLGVAPHLVNIRVGREAGAGGRAVAGDDVEHAWRQARLQRQLAGADRRKGRLLRRLHAVTLPG